jgi:hypothetical protein
MFKNLFLTTAIFIALFVITPSSVLAADYAFSYWDISNTTSPAVPGTAADETGTTSTIDYNWGSGSPSGIGADGFVARWTKTETLTAGDYYFETRSDDGSRVYVDDVLVVNAWVDQSITTTSNTVTLTAGSHDIRVEYYENASDAEMHFEYVNTNGPFFSDEFDVSSTTTLASVTPDIGSSWSQLINNGRTLRVASYNDYATTLSNGTNVGTLYVANATYPNADYQVSAVVSFSSGDSNYTRTLAARIQDANNMYILRFSSNTLWIYKRVTGTWTLLNSGSGTIVGSYYTTPGDTVTLKVEGTTISGLVNGVEKVTTTDSAISAAGQAGLGTGYVNISTDDSGTGVGMDDFLATGLLDVTAPTISTYSPTDGATGVTTTANLVMTFGEVVDVESGADNDIAIYKTTGDALIETIDSQDAKVTGTGTTIITINPAATLLESTDYYVKVGADAFDDTSSNSYAGISDKTTWNFTVGDFSGPGFSSLAATGADNGATVTWTTDEIGSSIVQYGLTTAYGKSTSETDTSPRVSDHSVTLSSLQSCRRYYYRVKSTDGSSNQSISSRSSFITTGCSIAEVSSGTESAVTTAAGGEFELTNNNSVAKLTIPSSFSGQNADFQINRLSTSGITPPTNKMLADENIFDLSAVDALDADLTSFDNNVTFTVTYGSDTEDSFDESTLDVYKYNSGTSSWDDKNCTLDMVANTLTCSLSTFSTYAVFGGQTESSSSTSSSSNTSTHQDAFCSALAPGGIPDLFQISTTADTATLYFTPILGINKYYLSFSTDESAEEHGAELNLSGLGVQSYTVNFLESGQKYFFKVRGQNGCTPGDWSNIKSATTIGYQSFNTDYLASIEPEEEIIEEEEEIIEEIVEEEIVKEVAPKTEEPEIAVPEEISSSMSDRFNIAAGSVKGAFTNVQKNIAFTWRIKQAKKSISNVIVSGGERVKGVSESIGYKIIAFGYTFIDEPTQIYDVEVLVISPTQTKVSWKTNHPANGKVNYGLDTTYTEDIQSDDLVTDHEFILENLYPDTIYHFEVMSHAKSYVYDANREFKTPLD